jgi:hypothetical protein
MHPLYCPAPYSMRYLAAGWYFSVIVYWRILGHCVLHTILRGRALKDAFVSSTTGPGGNGFCSRPNLDAAGWGVLASSRVIGIAFAHFPGSPGNGKWSAATAGFQGIRH